MATKQERIEFVTRALETGWPEDRVESMLYCNSAYDSPLPNKTWTPELLESHSNATLEVFVRDKQQEMDYSGPVFYPNDSLLIKAFNIACYCAGFVVGMISALLFGTNRNSK